MARTLEEIQQAIIDDKNSRPELAALDNASNAAIWRLWVYVVAFAIWLHENLWDVAEVKLEEKAASLQVGTSRWYVVKALDFQMDDTLEFDPSTYQVRYPEGSTGEKIVKRASISGTGSVSVLKVAKEPTLGSPEKLSAPELAQFVSYIDQIQFAGAQINVLSIDGDELKLFGDVYYVATFDQALIQANVEAAINDYLANLDFDGRLLINKLIDAVQAVEGVTDFYVTTSEAKNSVANVHNPFGRTYAPLSGYIFIDPTFPLSSGLTYNIAA